MSVVYGPIIFNPEVQVVVAHGRYRWTEERKEGREAGDIMWHVK